MLGWFKKHKDAEADWEPDFVVYDGAKYLFPFGYWGRGYVVDDERKIERFMAWAFEFKLLPVVAILVTLGIVWQSFLWVTHFDEPIDTVLSNSSSLFFLLVGLFVGLPIMKKTAASRLFPAIPAPIWNHQSRQRYFAGRQPKLKPIANSLMLAGLLCGVFAFAYYTSPTKATLLQSLTFLPAAVASLWFLNQLLMLVLHRALTRRS